MGGAQINIGKNCGGVDGVDATMVEVAASVVKWQRRPSWSGAGHSKKVAGKQIRTRLTMSNLRRPICNLYLPKLTYPLKIGL